MVIKLMSDFEFFEILVGLLISCLKFKFLKSVLSCLYLELL